MTGDDVVHLTYTKARHRNREESTGRRVGTEMWQWRFALAYRLSPTLSHSQIPQTHHHTSREVYSRLTVSHRT